MIETIEIEHKMKNKALQIMCLKLKVRKLIAKRQRHVAETMKNFPIASQRVDSIEKLDSNTFYMLDKEIEKYNRLIRIKSNN